MGDTLTPEADRVQWEDVARPGARVNDHNAYNALIANLQITRDFPVLPISQILTFESSERELDRPKGAWQYKVPNG